jgi:excisionase family DNA binding protein
MRLKDLPPTLTVAKAGEMLGIPRATAYRAAAAGQLPTFRIGRRLLVPTARLLDLLGLTEAGGDTDHTEPSA